MPSPSNLYAERIFAEHPLGLWPLDERLDYASLINEDQRKIFDSQYWSVSGGEAEEDSTVGPIPNTATSRILGDEPVGESGSILLTGPALINSNELNKNLGSFAIAAYVYSETIFVESVELGYQIDSQSPVLLSSRFNLLQSWRQLSRTFDIPENSGQVRPVIKINYTKSETPEQEYGFLVSGITVGQWSEQFTVSSLGFETEQIPQGIDLPESTFGFRANSYGQNTPGYYLGTRSSIAARNFGVPLVFGSENVTTITENGDMPSLIVPGFGFLNRLGQFRDMTLEFWLKLNGSPGSSRPIVKALSSQDGLYADGPFLTLKIGDRSESYFVGEWGRPMLVDITISNNFVSLLLNSEQVIFFPIEIDKLQFAPPESPSGKDGDWLAFYADEESSPTQIDCVAIYPYQVPEVMAKRRLVYAQGVTLPDNSDSSYVSSSVDINYPFARYANNYNYPDLGRWENGVSSNIEINRDVISLPEYDLPTVVFDSRKTQKQWLEDLSSVQLPTEETWYNLRPKTSWSQVNGYILFNNLESAISEQLAGFYGIFDKLASRSGVLIRVKDRLSNNYFEIVSENDLIVYKFFYNNSLTEVVSEAGIRSYEKFICGIDISTFSRFFGNNLSAFFGNTKNLQLYLGGREDFSDTFDGRIHSFHFANRGNMFLVKDFVQDSGVLLENGEFFPYREGVQSIPTIVGGFPEDIFYAQINGGDPDDEAEDLLDGGFPDTWVLEPPSQSAANSAYTLRLATDPIDSSQYSLTVASAASWQDYVPLSVLAKNVKNASNENYYSLDFVQVNFDYPRADRVVGDYLNTSSEFLRAYVTFQPLDLGAHRNIREYQYTVPASRTGTVEPGNYVVGMSEDESPILDSFINTKYEIVNGMIVYPPANIDRSRIAIAVHFELNIPDISRYPIKIKELQLASLALNDIAENPINTQSGTPIFPYTKLNIYFDYKRRNPFEIYKGNTPYLYLTKNSGIRLRGEQRVGISRGISMPINQGAALTYSVGAMQFAFRYDEPEFPATAIELFEIEARNDYIKFYLVSADSSGKRGRIYGINTRTGALHPGLVFYINGIIQREPIVDLKQWFIMGLQFIEPLRFDSFAGAFRVTGPILINNVYHYQYSSFQEIQTVRPRAWLAILNTPQGTAIWEDYEESTWLDLLYVLTLQKPVIDPRRIYRTYTGTNKFVVGDSTPMSFDGYKYKLYTEVVWDSLVIDPV